MLKPDYMKLIRSLPPFVRSVCDFGNGWITGSVSDNMAPGNDWDICIPVYNWPSVSRMIVSGVGVDNVTVTSFGGFRFTIDGHRVDVFPKDIDELLKIPGVVSAWQPATGIRLVKQVIKVDIGDISFEWPERADGDQVEPAAST